MAQIYTWDRQGFESTYWKYVYKLKGCGAATPRNCRCHDAYTTYTRTFFDSMSMFYERAVKIKTKLNLPDNSTVLVVGCALGFLMEQMQRVKLVPYGFDNSTYINGAKGKERVTFDIPNIDILSNTVAADLNRAFKINKFDCVVTEDVLPSHDSYTEILNNCESLLKPGLPSSRVVHIVETNVEPPFIKKSLNDWKFVRPQHTWLDQNGNS